MDDFKYLITTLSVELLARILFEAEAYNNGLYYYWIMCLNIAGANTQNIYIYLPIPPVLRIESVRYSDNVYQFIGGSKIEEGYQWYQESRNIRIKKCVNLFTMYVDEIFRITIHCNSFDPLKLVSFDKSNDDLSNHIVCLTNDDIYKDGMKIHRDDARNVSRHEMKIGFRAPFTETCQKFSNVKSMDDLGVYEK